MKDLALKGPVTLLQHFTHPVGMKANLYKGFDHKKPGALDLNLRVLDYSLAFA